MKNVFFLDTMITPKMITLVYWLLLFLSFSFSIAQYRMFGSALMALVVMAALCISARIWCELLIIFFKMNDALQDLRKTGLPKTQ